jgi:hypothetical protein
VTAEEEYLNQVRRAMAGMAAPVRDDILRELRGHIVDSTAANGGNVSASLLALGSPRTVGRHYRELYGYGTIFKFLFVAIGFLLAVPSVPVLLVGPVTTFPFTLSILFVVFASAWILWVGVVAGRTAGLLVGFAGMAGRLVAFGFAILIEPDAITTAGGLTLLLAVSAVFVLLGWIPGTAREAWSSPRTEI